MTIYWSGQENEKKSYDARIAKDMKRSPYIIWSKLGNLAMTQVRYEENLASL